MNFGNPRHWCLKSYETWMEIQLLVKFKIVLEYEWKSDQLGWNSDQTQKAAVF